MPSQKNIYDQYGVSSFYANASILYPQS